MQRDAGIYFDEKIVIALHFQDSQMLREELA